MDSEDVEEVKNQQRRILLSSLFFILGFSMVFITLGATASFLGSYISSNQVIFRQVGGVIVIVLGLHMTGLIQIKPLLYEKRMHVKARPPGYFGAFLIGLSFALGWTPCIGPILGAILGLAGSKGSVLEGIKLLSLYSLGLAIPFFITALMMDKIFVHFRKLQKHMQTISIVSGVFLMLVGVLIFTNMLQVMSNYFLSLEGV